MTRVPILALVASCAMGVETQAQEARKQQPARPAVAKTAAPKVAPAGASDSAADEAALKALLDSFVKAFNAGDAKAAAATYSTNAIVVAEDGTRTEGREAIESQYAGYFADHPGGTIAISIGSLRMLGPETALEEGHATITRVAGGEEPEVTRFTAIYVKQDGRWLQAAVRDEPETVLTPHQHLKSLEWMVGEWVNESQDAVVFTTCKWAHDGNFLDREFTVKMQGKPVLSGTQRIGWDPLKHQFKAWIFDSEGGHGEGYMSNDGDTWVIKVDGVRQDGQPVSATNIITRLGKDRTRWQSVDRTLGGAAVPGSVEFVVVRKPPEIGK